MIYGLFLLFLVLITILNFTKKGMNLSLRTHSCLEEIKITINSWIIFLYFDKHRIELSLKLLYISLVLYHNDLLEEKAERFIIKKRFECEYYLV